MSQRALLAFGVAAIAGAAIIGVATMSAGSSFPALPGFSSNVPAKTISIDQAQRSVQSFLDRTGDSDLKIDELMEFEQNFYALIKEKSTGIGAFELLVNKANGAVELEPGPNMMWNTKYSPMRGGMMSGGMMQPGSFSYGTSGANMPISADAATKIGQAWLDRSLPGDSAGTADAFYGYYTFHFEKNGVIAGMLSVNGYSGIVWFHTWHGSFVQGRDFGG